MKSKYLLLLAIIFLAITIPNCSKDSAGVDVFIPNLSNAWEDAANNNFYNFQNYQPNVNESDFDGFDNNNGAFTGHFKNYDIYFTFSEGAEQGVTYSGQILKSDPSVMNLTGNPGNKKITLKRQ